MTIEKHPKPQRFLLASHPILCLPLLLATVVAFFGLPMSARAQSPTISSLGTIAPTPGANDQYQLNTGNDSDCFGGIYYYDRDPAPGQTFTTGSNPNGYMLNTFSVAIIPDDGLVSSTWGLRIYSVSGSTATLLTNYISQNFLIPQDPDWLQMTNLGMTLSPNTPYAYTFHRESASSGWSQMSSVSGNPYPGGQICLIPTGGGSITYCSSGTRDAAFDIGLNVTQASLTFTTQPVGATAGATMPSCVLKAWTGANGTGSPVSGVSVSLTLSAGSFGAGSTTTLTTDANGLATFNNLNITTAGSYTITASDGAGHTVQSTPAFTITAGGAHQLGFGVQPGTTTVGSAISPAVTVLVQDQYGNTVITDSSSVTIAGTTFAFGSTLTVAAINGIATFSNIKPTIVGNNSISLTASDGSLTSTTSSSFTVNAPSPIISSLGTTAPTPGANDQYQLTTGTDVDCFGGIYYYDRNPAPGQTFTTGSNPNGYMLNTFSVAIIPDDSLVASTWGVRIYLVSGSTATLLTNYISQNFLIPQDPDWLQMTNLGMTLSPNTPYAYTFHRESASSGWSQMSSVSGNPYPGGQICLIPTGGGSITYCSSGTRDAAFDIGLTANLVVPCSATVAVSSNYPWFSEPLTNSGCVCYSSLVFDATVSPVAPCVGTPTGTVQFRTNGVAMFSPVTLSAGAATLTMDPRQFPTSYTTVSAEYSGDGMFNANTNSFQQMVRWY